MYINVLRILIILIWRVCWNWQTGMIEGHVLEEHEGSIPSTRTK